ncbi:MAG: relaxase, partial [Pseudomonadota bacterium]
MILNGSQRSGGRDLAAHLANLVDNDHVELHEIRGFGAETMRGAFQEAEAVAKGTECTQYLFSLSLNPPETERVGTDTFEAAVAAAEERLGLKDQPRLIIFHEKNGRRHAHAVWSRIDVQKMKALRLCRFIG